MFCTATRSSKHIISKSNMFKFWRRRGKRNEVNNNFRILYKVNTLVQSL